MTGHNSAAVLICLFVVLGLTNCQTLPPNSVPYWNDQSIQPFLDGISEDTEIGTSVARLECFDDDGDIIYYQKIAADSFRVDIRTGDVTLIKKLDFEAENNAGIDIEFACVDIIFDEDGRAQIRSVDWIVYQTEFAIVDANDNRPLFETENPGGYVFDVAEIDPSGTVLVPSFTVRDLDSGNNAVLKELYLICDSSDQAILDTLDDENKATCEKFRVEFAQVGEGVYQATMFLKDTLDYETQPVYISQLVAVDGRESVVSKTSSINVQMRVLDSQDTDPEFTNPGDSATISESTEAGTTLNFGVSARDGDTGARRPVELDIVQGELDYSYFDLTPAIVVERDNEPGTHSSQLIIVNSLDREVAPSYRFVAKVTEMDDTTDPPTRTDATATLTYSVFISDINDNPPAFSQPVYTVDVTEMITVFDSNYVPVRIPELHIVVEDPDEPSNSRYVVDITSQTFDGAYSVTPTGATLSDRTSIFLLVNNPEFTNFDNPDYREQTVELEATQVGSIETYTTTATVLISLVDVNDNTPIFTSLLYEFSVNENVQPPYPLGTVEAPDKDSGDFGRVTYSLEGATFDLFEINSTTGDLELVGEVNHEGTPEYSFLVVARDGDDTPRSTQVQVIVKINDVNDEAPIFKQPLYQTSVEELSLVFYTPIIVQAEDSENPDAIITYRIVDSPSNAFFMNRDSGELSLLTNLDYQDTPEDINGDKLGYFTLTVEASDNGIPPQTNDVAVIVNVIDQNNHGPVMFPTLYEATISEISAPGTFVADVTATDNDVGDFGTITYRLGPGSAGHFSVDPVSGIVTVGVENNFDFDAVQSYRLTILATDGGAPQRTASATVDVDLIDKNTKAPYFPRFLYQEIVNQDAAVDEFVMQVEAEDDDDNAVLVYRILEDTYRASDTSGNTLAVNDRDNPEIMELFRIDPNDGSIYVNSPDLIETIAQQITFFIEVEDIASDTGDQITTIRVFIIIRGEPDNEVVFDPVAIAVVSEEQTIGYDIATFVARDHLTDRLITDYTLLDGSSEYMELDTRVGRTGKVLLKRLVDYERGPRQHIVMVVGRTSRTDGSVNSASATMTINVLDANDNSPVFFRDSYIAEISEDDRFPKLVTRVQATDADSGSFGPISYSITGGLDADDFQIFEPRDNPGAVVIVADGVTLDYNRRSLYVLTIIAVDNPSLELSSTRLTSAVTLTIRIIDENNNVPYFKDRTPFFDVPETADIGQDIAVIQAFDDDIGDNGAISYFLEPGDFATGAEAVDLFGISSTTGLIFVASSLLGRGGITYTFNVRAQDHGTRPNSEVLQASITVLSTEDDDGNPRWSSPESLAVFYAPEEEPFALTELRDAYNVVPRTGQDLTFSLSEYSDAYEDLSIDSETGLVSIVNGLDRERQAHYEILVFAEDVDDKSKLRTGRSFIISLIDKDDNIPIFTNPRRYAGCGNLLDRPFETIYVEENTIANTRVFHMPYCDPDEPQNSHVIYESYRDEPYCVEQMADNIFTIQEDGWLVTNELIDYEHLHEYVVCVEIREDTLSNVRKKRHSGFDISAVADPVPDNVAYIHIVITDQNDHGPVFPTPKDYAVVLLSPTGGAVHILDAVDRDGSSYNNIVYRIENSVFYPANGDEAVVIQQAFELRGNTGAIFANFPSYLPYENGRFVLHIRATDSVDDSMTDEQELTIYVYDVANTIKLILDIDPLVGVDTAVDLLQDLNDVDNVTYFFFISASENRLYDGVEVDKTAVCFVAANSDTNRVLDISRVIDLLDNNNYQRVLLTDEYQFEDRGKCYPSRSSEDDVEWDDLWWVLVAVGIFLFICCVICIILIAILYRNYKRYMETRKTYLVEQ